MKPIFLATQYNINPDTWADHTRLRCMDKTLAQQQFRDECDINVLFARYLDTGEMPQLQNQGLAYGDFSGVFDFMTAMNFVRDAQEKFSQLPAKIKNRFDNNPQKLIDFLEDPENRDEAEFLGLVSKRADATAPGAPALETGSTSPAKSTPSAPATGSDQGNPGKPAAPQ